MSAIEDSNPQPFIVTIHALERMEERFGEIAISMTDERLGEFIHGEVMDALDQGRYGSVPPLELASYAKRGGDWGNASKKGTYVVWTEDKLRGYVLAESPEELLVLTVLYGTPREIKQSQMRGTRGIK